MSNALIRDTCKYVRIFMCVSNDMYAIKRKGVSFLPLFVFPPPVSYYL